MLIHPDGRRSALHPLLWALPKNNADITALSEDNDQSAIASLQKIAGMVETISQALGIPTPDIVLPSGLVPAKFSSYAHRMLAPHPELTGDAITLGTRLIDGLGALGNTGQARPELCLNDDELYAILAHEIGHLSLRHTPPIFPPTPTPDTAPEHSIAQHKFARQGNHLQEYEADAQALKAGATRHAIKSGILKMMRDDREQILRQGSFGAQLAANPEAAQEQPLDARLALRSSLTARRITAGSLTHPALTRRDASMALLETDPDNWEARVTNAKKHLKTQPPTGRGS